MANYPTSASSDTNLYLAVNNKRTTLNGAINNSVTTVTVASTTGFPTSGFISIDLEIIAYTGTNATQFTGCTRGSDGTTAASHTDTTLVVHRVIAAHHNAPKDEIIAIETDLVAVKSALNDAATPGSTATDVKNRLDQIVSELKRINGLTNWYDSVPVSLKNIATDTFIGGRNRLINGAMVIDQQNGGASVSVNNTTDFFTVDGIRADGQSADGVFSVQRLSATPPTGFTNYLRITVTTADASIGAAQTYRTTRPMEGYFFRDSLYGTANARTFTYSFWVRSSLTGTFSVSFVNGNDARSYTATYTISSANTWEFKTIVIPGDTSATTIATTTASAFTIVHPVGVGTNQQTATINAWTAGEFRQASTGTQIISTNGATFDLTGVQFERGGVATEFEHRPFQQEFTLCQRYFEKSYDIDTAVATNTSTDKTFIPAVQSDAGNYVGTVFMRITKRAVPTITFYRTDGTSGSWQARSTAGTDANITPSALDIARHSFRVSNGTNSSPTLHGHWIADARA